MNYLSAFISLITSSIPTNELPKFEFLEPEVGAAAAENVKIESLTSLTNPDEVFTLIL